jgi:hypothetical protein
LIEKLLRDAPDHSDNRIADAVGVSDKTVTAVREKLESTSEIPKLNRTIGKDGKSRPTKQKKKRKLPKAPPVVAKPAPDPAPPKVEPSAIVPPGDDGLDIPPALRRAKPTLPPAEPAKPAPVDDPEASAERRKADYAALFDEPETDGDLIATFEDAIRKLLPLATQPVERFAAANVQPDDLEKIEYFLSYVGIEIIVQRKPTGRAA